MSVTHFSQLITTVYIDLAYCLCLPGTNHCMQKVVVSFASVFD